MWVTCPGWVESPRSWMWGMWSKRRYISTASEHETPNLLSASAGGTGASAGASSAVFTLIATRALTRRLAATALIRSTSLGLSATMTPIGPR